jgi:hypothetical protein
VEYVRNLQDGLLAPQALDPTPAAAGEEEEEGPTGHGQGNGSLRPALVLTGDVLDDMDDDLWTHVLKFREIGTWHSSMCG